SATRSKAGGASMDLARGLDTLLLAAAVAALAPVIVALLPGPRIPQVVVLLAGGVLIGPRRSAGPTGPPSTWSPTSDWVPVPARRLRAGPAPVPGALRPAGALVGAGALSVLVFPTAAVAVHQRRRTTRPPGTTSEEREGGGGAQGL